jgi:hypothetical protein
VAVRVVLQCLALQEERDRERDARGPASAMSFVLSFLRRQTSRTLPPQHVSGRTYKIKSSISVGDKTELPLHDEWRERFGASALAIRDRISVANQETANTLAQSFISGKSIARGTKKTIIESFPGKLS